MAAQKKAAKKAKIGSSRSVIGIASFGKQQWVIVACFVVLFGGIGTYFITKSNAYTCDNTVLYRGMSGYCVSVAQKRLNYYNCDDIRVDGIFGYNTYNATRNFQAYYSLSNTQVERLSIDGIIGPNTWYALWTAPWKGCYPHNKTYYPYSY